MQTVQSLSNISRAVEENHPWVLVMESWNLSDLTWKLSGGDAAAYIPCKCQERLTYVKDFHVCIFPSAVFTWPHSRTFESELNFSVKVQEAVISK